MGRAMNKVTRSEGKFSTDKLSGKDATRSRYEGNLPDLRPERGEELLTELDGL